MMVLQAIGVGGPRFFRMGLFVLIIAAAMAYWVYTDAEKRGKDNALLWGLGVGILTLLTLLGGIVALIVYVWKR